LVTADKASPAGLSSRPRTVALDGRLPPHDLRRWACRRAEPVRQPRQRGSQFICERTVGTRRCKESIAGGWNRPRSRQLTLLLANYQRYDTDNYDACSQPLLMSHDFTTQANAEQQRNDGIDKAVTRS
jgi:hypothetical protein